MSTDAGVSSLLGTPEQSGSLQGCKAVPGLPDHTELTVTDSANEAADPVGKVQGQHSRYKSWSFPGTLKRRLVRARIKVPRSLRWIHTFKVQGQQVEKGACRKLSSHG